MGNAYSDEELAKRTFVLTIAGVLGFIAVVFLFIL